jgi:hypothetical protein
MTSEPEVMARDSVYSGGDGAETVGFEPTVPYWELHLSRVVH